MATISFEPLISPALWIALLVISAALLMWYARRRPGHVRGSRWAAIIALMAGGVGTILAVLLNPTWVEPIPPPAGKPLLAILVDSSVSMAAPDASGGKTRYEAAAGIARTLAERLTDRFEIQVRRFDAAVAPVDPAQLDSSRPEGPFSDLAGALASSLNEPRAQGQAVVLLSDGIHNTSPLMDEVLEAAQLAKAMAVPIYTKTIGGEADIQDLAVNLHSQQELAFVDQVVPVKVRIEHRGFAGAQTDVALVCNEEELNRKQVALVPDQPAEIRFEVHQALSGLYRYEIKAQAFPSEATRVNNSATFLLRVVDEPLRILLLEGKPYWDSKFVIRTLASDQAVDLESVVKLTDDRLLYRRVYRVKNEDENHATSRPAEVSSQDFPQSLSSGQPDQVVGSGVAWQREEDWAITADASRILADVDRLRSYQIIVLGRDAEAYLSEAAVDGLRRWIARDGGALVCYRGAPVAQVDQRLASLLPVDWLPGKESRFRIQLTQRGEDLRWLLGGAGTSEVELLTQMPSLATAAQVKGAKPMAVILATAESYESASPQAVVSYQLYGSGRVVVVEGAGMWRWAFLSPKYQQHDNVYRDLWQSLLRWLASSTGLLPGQEIALQSDRISFNTLESCAATLLIREEASIQAVPKILLEGDALPENQMYTPAVLGDEPGTFRVVFGRLPEGHYRATALREDQPDSFVQVAFDVHRFAGEELDLKARPDLMTRIANDSGGAVIDSADPSETARQFQSHLAKSKLLRVQRISAWDRWWVLLAIIFVWTVSWALRRSGGLI